MAKAGRSAPDLGRTWRRARFYISGVARDALPYAVYQRRLDRIFARLAETPPPEEIIRRVNYCNKLDTTSPLTESRRIRDIPIRPSTYYSYDLKQYAKYFGGDHALRYFFGDLITVPPEPTIVKSRPIHGDNRNSVLFKLDKLRHFTLHPDPVAFADKRKSAVWRGAIADHSGLRDALVRRFHDHKTHDIGHVGRAHDGIAAKNYLAIADQLRHRYLISVEGYDVATNLKWILASQSLCLMPKPLYETWFMEGTLVAGKHFVEVRPDFADLEEVVAYYDRNENEARAIIAEANRYVATFQDEENERLVSLLVLQKYLERTDQRPPMPWSHFFGGS